MSLNSWAAVCLNVLAKPVTNSVYYKAARSRLPGQGWIQLEWCVRLGELFLEFRHRTSLWSRLDFSSVCPLHQSRSFLSRDSHAAPASPPGSLPPVPGSVYLLIRGWSRGWGRAGAQSESGSREPIRIALGHCRGPNSRSLLEKEFSKRSLLVTSVVTASFLVREPGPVFVCLKPFLSTLPFLTPTILPGVGRKTSRKSQV